MTSRRSFLRYLLSLPIAATLDVEKLLWIPKPIITVPFNPILDKLYGIPYHEYNFSTGTWLGVMRSTEIWNYNRAMAELINLIEKDKKN